jgi:replicative DNA helicase
VNDSELDRLWSLSGEAGVLGSMMLDSSVVSAVLAILPRADLFYKPEHREIFAALVAVYGQGKPIDAVMLRDELEQRGQLEEIGGVEYIRRILESVPSAASAEYYAKIVAERAEYRQLVAAVEAMRKTLDDPGTVAEQARQIQAIAFQLPTSAPQTDRFSLSGDATIIAVKARDGESDIIRTGFRNIDRLIGGVAPGEMIIVAGRPSMGKSAFALGVTLSMARDGRCVFYVTLEMTGRSLIERAICMAGKVNLQAVKIDEPKQENLTRFYEAAMLLEKYDVTFRENLTTAESIIAAVEQQNRIKRVECVVIDYLQLMSGGKNRSRYEEITNISRAIKLAALRLHVPIITLSQLNRQPEEREHHKPRLSDLRDSGALEQDADVVMLLHREDYYRRYAAKSDSDKFDGLAEIDIAKNRRGPCGIAHLTFLDKYVAFADLIDEAEL